MTEAASSGTPKPGVAIWFDAWKSCTQDVLSQVSGQPNAFELVFEPLATSDSDLHYTVTASGAVQGELSFRISPASALRLARKFLGETEPPAETGTISDDDREALEELLRQIGGLVATAVGGGAGGPVQLQLVRADASWAGTADAIASLRTRDETGTEIALEIRISPALAAMLVARAEAKPAEPVAPPPESGPAPADAAPAPSSVSPAAVEDVIPDEPPAAGYRRLLDVGLGVKLRFGTRKMLLRDVLALSSGLVVELENKLSSPVDLLLDGRVIARGEVVVIDGKYGLRVTDVIDRPGATAPAAD